MLPEPFKTDWIAALRSGKYEQGSGYLRELGKYCCLGVACIVAGAEPEDIEHHSLITTDMNIPVPVELIGTMLMVEGKPGNLIAILATMNDGVELIQDRKSFLEIADYIEENL